VRATPRLAVVLNGYGLDHWEKDGGHRDLLGWDDLRGLARLAEDLGYEAIFAPEISGREAFSTLAGFARETDRIRLATGVVPLRARDLLTLGMAASSLDEMSGRRFTLGVGSQASIERTRETIRALRDVVAGDEGIRSGPDGPWATGQLDWHTNPRRIPLWLAGLGPRMVDLAGRAADGVLLNWCTPERVAAARKAIPRRGGFTMAVYVRACLAHVDDAASAALKVAAARYLHLPPYARQFEAMGLGAEVRAAREALRGDQSPEEAVPDRVVESTCVLGDRESAIDRLGLYADAGADLVAVYPVPAREAVSSLSGTMMAVAPNPAVEA
jgi:alkanesulfonate monooxygenase SsuD/methylene tetrahydromethanopterin reductase-like flavin-dependent oxidoreductase (luciferase family)